MAVPRCHSVAEGATHGEGLNEWDIRPLNVDISQPPSGWIHRPQRPAPESAVKNMATGLCPLEGFGVRLVTLKIISTLALIYLSVV